MILGHTEAVRAWGARLVPGVALTVVIALAAIFLAERFGGPLMLLALLLGMALNFASTESSTAAGVAFATTHILRVGVALLGARISLEQVSALGSMSILIVAGTVLLTIAFGAVAATYLGMNRRFGIVSGGAVAICGASAALAISAALPKSPNGDRDTIIAIVGVTTLSTVAMVLYPGFAVTMGWDNRAAGFFLGASIHDVAQVVGAGYSISLEAGDFATFTKLTRVLLLVPVVAVVSLIYRAKAADGERRPVPLPAFLLGFIALMAANSLGIIPRGFSPHLGEISRFCLVVAVAALGMKTSFKSLLTLGWRAVSLIVAETLFLAAIVVAVLLIEY